MTPVAQNRPKSIQAGRGQLLATHRFGPGPIVRSADLPRSRTGNRPVDLAPHGPRAATICPGEGPSIVGPNAIRSGAHSTPTSRRRRLRRPRRAGCTVERAAPAAAIHPLVRRTVPRTCSSALGALRHHATRRVDIEVSGQESAATCSPGAPVDHPVTLGRNGPTRAVAPGLLHRAAHADQVRPPDSTMPARNEAGRHRGFRCLGSPDQRPGNSGGCHGRSAPGRGACWGCCGAGDGGIGAPPCGRFRG